MKKVLKGKYIKRIVSCIMALTIILTGMINVKAEGKNQTLINIRGTSMVLGNNLNLEFYVPIEELKGNENVYALITKQYADGRDDVVVKIPYKEWKTSKEIGNLKYVDFNGISAKEMMDKVSVQIYDNSGKVISNLYTDSIHDYVIRLLKKEKNDKLKTLIVDMLNYGAACQTYFEYDKSNLSNKDIGEYQKFASKNITFKDNSIIDDNYIGTCLMTKSNILMSMFFKNITPDMHAKISYVNHRGQNIEYTVNGKDFEEYKGKYGVVTNTLVVADLRQMVKCEVYDSNDKLVASATDSIESYVSRCAGKSEVFEKIANFGDSAYKYFHKEDLENGIITLGSATVKQGEKNVKIPMMLENNPGILGMTLQLNYDESAMTLVKVERGTALSELTFTMPRDLTTGTVFPWDGEYITPDMVTNGQLVMLTFDIKEDAVPGKYDFELWYDQGAIIDNDLNPLDIKIVNGNISIEKNEEASKEGTITLSSADVVRGQKGVKLPMMLENNPGILGMTLQLNYDESAMTLVKVERGTALSELTFTMPRDLTTGTVFPWDGEYITPDMVTNGQLVMLTFDIKEDAVPGKYDFELWYDPGAIIDNDLKPLDIKLVSGFMNIK